MVVGSQPDLAVRLEQAVHGYEDGHRLLASSSELVAADRRVLARQTDNADAGRVAGWDALLAGYPLPSGLFALSMTWSAPEMPRPGCVWTHTLLLDTAGLRAASPSLLSLFRRPRGPVPETAGYRQGLTIRPGGPATRWLQIVSWAEVLAWSLYEPPARSVRVLRMDLHDDERHELLIGVWMMAWTALRGTVSFCDAPQTPRLLDDRQFDLQLHQTSRADRADVSEARVLRGLPRAGPPLWARQLAGQIPKPGPLARFVADHGAKLEPSRIFVRPLVRVFDAYMTRNASEDQRAEAVVSILGEEFPTAGAGTALKADLLVVRRGEIPVLDDSGVLRGLVTTTVPEAFSGMDLNLVSRVRRLSLTNSKALWSVIDSATDDLRPIADAVLTAFTEVSIVDGFQQWSLQDPETIRNVVRHRPVVLEHVQLWTTVHPSILWPEAARQRGAARRMAIVKAMVAAAVGSLAEVVVTDWNDGSDLLISALVQATELDTSALDSWLAPVPSETLLDFLRGDAEVTDAFAAAAIRRMDVAAIAAVGPGRVTAALRGDKSIDVAVAAFLGALERPHDVAWAEIGTTAYCRVVDRASKDELGPARERLRQVEPELPEWDVVARVARAASEAFKDGRWPIEAALGIRDESAFAALVRGDKRAGLARAMLERAASGDVNVTPWQSDLIISTIRERSDRDSLMKTLEGLARSILRF